MKRIHSREAEKTRLDSRLFEMACRILRSANRRVPKIEVIQEILKILIHDAGSDAILLWLKNGEKQQCWKGTRRKNNALHFEALAFPQDEGGQRSRGTRGEEDLQGFFREIRQKHFDSPWAHFTKNGSFWTDDLKKLSLSSHHSEKSGHRHTILDAGGTYRSIALIPFTVDEAGFGILQLGKTRPNFFTSDVIEFYEGMAQILGVALVNRRVQAAFHERIKELDCLYNIAHLSKRPDRPLDEILLDIAELLPPAWQYPDVAFARIIFDGRTYALSGFPDGMPKQTADIVVNGHRQGVLEVAYSEDKPEIEEGPFLKEERKLIETVSRELALIIEWRLYEEEKPKLLDQIRHADRLAIIGQLAAAVAHEINEPLGDILGFAQLSKKCPGLPRQAEEDLEKIEAASLHTRDIVRKLLLFARQMPSKESVVNLNQSVEKGLYFLESRCAKEGIVLERLLSPDLPEINADPGQLRQVVANLVVNSMQAMPDGGKLTIRTHAVEGHVSLVVEDTGIGMSEEVKEKIFIPFFTTKDTDQGTGLGLAVVHGIVVAHGGSTQVESRVGHGTRVEIRLPLTGTEGM